MTDPKELPNDAQKTGQNIAKSFLDSGNIAKALSVGLPDTSQYAAAILNGEQLSRLQDTVSRMVEPSFSMAAKIQEQQKLQVRPAPFAFTPDDSPRRTAEHTEAIADSMTSMLEITNLLATLTEANLNAAKQAEKRSFWLTVTSLILGLASAGAAITSVVLFINAPG